MIAELPIDLNSIQLRLASLGRTWNVEDVATVLRETGFVVSDAVVLNVMQQLRLGSVGAGPLEALLRLPTLTDVVVNGWQQVFVDQGEGLHEVASPFSSDDEVRRLAVRLAAGAGRRLDDSVPFVDARLTDGTRFHAVLSPVAAPGTCLSLRVPSRREFALDDWLDNGSIDRLMYETLHRIVKAKKSFLISGGTGTGKTTLLSSLLNEIPRQERILIIEDSRELVPSHPHCVRLEARPANSEGAGRITLTDLVRQALRMRPDRLVLGEARGAELVDLLAAMNTGHEGGCGTLHANSAHDVPARLEALASLGGLNRAACHAQVTSAVDLVIHLQRVGASRHVGQIGVVKRKLDGEIGVVDALVTVAGRTRLREGNIELERMLQ